MEKSIEVIDINLAWLSNLVETSNIMTSSLVAELPKGLYSATSIVVNNQMIIFGGFSNIQVSNSDIFIFNVDNNNVSTLPSVFASMAFGQKTYLLPKGKVYVLFHLRFFDIENNFSIISSKSRLHFNYFNSCYRYALKNIYIKLKFKD
jgi:hypothetical protein